MSYRCDRRDDDRGDWLASENAVDAIVEAFCGDSPGGYLRSPTCTDEDPRLVSSCPHCGSSIRFDPFVVDGPDFPAVRP